MDSVNQLRCIVSHNCDLESHVVQRDHQRHAQTCEKSVWQAAAATTTRQNQLNYDSI